MKYKAFPFLLATTFLSTSAMAITLEPTLENSAISYSEGNSSDYNFTIQEADSDGNLTTKYYKININKDKLSTSSNISWIALDSKPDDMTNVVEIALPNNQAKYFKYTYIKPSKYTATSARINDTLALSNVTNVVFSGINSTLSGGAIYNTQNNSSVNIEGDFVGNSSSVRGGAIYNYYDGYSSIKASMGKIKGSFIGNYVSSTSSGVQGGAIYNNNGTIANITNDFIGNYANGTSASGGAIHNYKGTNTGVVGNFIGNYAKATSGIAVGGAIYNGYGYVGGTYSNYIGSFIGNYATSTSFAASGGAIYNYAGNSNSTAIISNITGDFIGNYASGSSSVYGGAIYNYAGSSSTAIIGNITGDFIGNYAKSTSEVASGGAIYNVNSGSKIGNITGDFIGNYIVSNGSPFYHGGGAIYNGHNATIGDITGDFIENYTSGTIEGGSTIYNDGTIGNITGNFIGNYYASGSYSSYGGMIFNAGTIGNITGDFIGNHSGNSFADAVAINNKHGTISDITGDFIGNSDGAIRNNGFDSISTIGNIKGDFINNSGGAIINSYGDSIRNITGDFIGNYSNYNGAAIRNEGVIYSDYIVSNFIGNNNTGGYGGAIYNSGTIADIAGRFIDNYAKVTSGTAKGGAIYSNQNITLLAKSNGSSVIKDNYVEDKDGKRAEAIYMDSSSAILTLKANNKGTIEVYDIINGVEGYDVKLTGDGTGSVSIFNDINNADVIAENVEVNLSNGAVKDYTFKTLTVGDATSWNLDLDMVKTTADNITSSGSTGTVLIGKINNIGSTDDVIIVQVLKNIDNKDALQLALGDNFKIFNENVEVENIVNYSDNYVREWGVALATTDTTNDSIKIEKDAFFDTLALINDKETSEERSFIFDEAGTQTLNEDLLPTTAGILNIKGFNNDAESSIIDANGHSLFDLSNATTLNASSVTLSNALGDAITVSEQAELNLTNVLFENNDGNAITSYGNVNINVKDTDIAMSENISMNGDNPNIIGLSFNVENGALNLSNEISGSDYNMYLKGGNVNVSGSISGVNNLEMSPSAILGLGTSGRISTNNMMHAQDTTDISLQSSTSPTLQIDVDVANNRMSNGIIDVSGDVSGAYGVIVNALSTEYAETPSIFLSALQDDATTSSEFSVLRVKGSPYMWKTVLNAEGETAGSTWYLAMEKPVEPEDPNTPDNPNDPAIDAILSPEVIAGVGLHAAGIEQTRTVVRNVAGKVANARSYCPNCGIVSDAWDGKQLNNGWVLAQGEYSNIDKPVDMEAKIWGVEGGFDLQSDMNNTFGIFASYRNGEYDLSGKGARYLSDIGSKIEIDSYLAGLYYRYDKNMNWMFATVYGGTQDAEAKMDDGISSFETDGLEFGASAEIGHSFALSKNTILSPSLGVYYTQINYDDANDNVGKKYEWDDIKHLEAELGLSLAKNFENGKVYVKPSVIQTLTDDDKVSITGLNEADTYHDQTLGRVEVGGNYGFNNNWSAYGWANYTFGSSYDATSLGAGVNYSW